MYKRIVKLTSRLERKEKKSKFMLKLEVET